MTATVDPKPLSSASSSKRPFRVDRYRALQAGLLALRSGPFLILLILVTVSAIDWISGKLRFAIIGRRAVA